MKLLNIGGRIYYADGRPAAIIRRASAGWISFGDPAAVKLAIAAEESKAAPVVKPRPAKLVRLASQGMFDLKPSAQ